MIIKQDKFSWQVFAFLLIFLQLNSLGFASVTKVGNGDDGSDLEGAQPVSSGLLLETRVMAVERIKKLNVPAVPGLGTLLPEVEKAQLLLAKRDIEAQMEVDRGMESSMDGRFLYARTFSEPHAATRFFPAALKLGEDQLIALHIHEGLHRALPASIREDEIAVTRLTMAIASPDANFDRVARIARMYMPGGAETAASPSESRQESTAAATLEDRSLYSDLAGSISLKKPSSETSVPSHLSYSYRIFEMPRETSDLVPVRSMHSLSSLLYPFGRDGRAVGLGLGLSYVQGEQTSFLGPMAVELRVRLAMLQEFELGLWGNSSLNSFSEGNLKNSPLGRDVKTLGLSLRKETPYYYLENLLSYSPAGEAKQRIGNVEYLYSFGGTTTGSIRAGGRLKDFSIGAILEMHVAESYSVAGREPLFSTGAYRILTAGPELSWNHPLAQLTMFGRWIVDAPAEMDLDYLGDLNGRGAGKGNFGVSMSIKL